MKGKIAVIGIGNPLRKDDGIGIVLLERLRKQKKKLSPTLEFIDGGTGGMNLLHILSQYDTVIIIDAVDFRGKPAENHMYQLEEMYSRKTAVSVSTHESDFLKVIRLSEQLQKRPYKVFIFAVQPKDVSFGTTFSDEIAQAVDPLTLALQNKIQELIA